jgi:signal transduction histidine kinase/ligand-binding sensor domain-containing protein
MWGTVGKLRRRVRELVALGTGLGCILLAGLPCAFALDPSLDVSQYAHAAWKVREGFVGSEINSIAQTPDGYIWLATEFGLFRFDGVRNVPWQPPQDQHLPPGSIFSLLVDRDGTLWIGAKGLASFRDGKVTHYPELAGHYIFKILEDHEGTIWASGLTDPIGKLCAIRNGNIQCYGEDGTLGRGAFNLYEDSKGNLWAGVLNGLWQWKPGPPKFYSLAGEPDGIQALGEDIDGSLLVGWREGIYRFVEGKTELYSLRGAPRHFRAKRMLRDRNGGLWIGTWDRGLLHVRQGRTDVFQQSDGLSGESIHSFFQDREDNIWVGTINGLDRFRDFAVSTLTEKQGLSNGVTHSVLAGRDGSVWFGTRVGLDRWNNGQIKTYETGGNKHGGKLSLLANSLFQDDRGRIWVSTLRELGYLENGRFTSIKGVPGGPMLSITQDTAGNVWVINEHVGLFRISPQNDVQQIPWSSLGHQDHASVLVADHRQGGLWIGFFLGGVAYFSDGQVRATYTTTDGLGAGRISDFRFEDDGALWVSTEGGLSRLKNNRMATLTSKNGLPCDTVHWAMEEDDRSLWLYTACGLVRISRSELDAWAAAVDKSQGTGLSIRVTVFDSSDGVRSVPDPGHYHPQVAKTPDGRLWFLPWDGVSVIDPHHIPFNTIPPPVHVEQVVADDKAYEISSGLRLPAQTRHLEIDYTALSFVAPEKVLFLFKLEGQDRDWRDVGTRRQAFYTNLSPGNYRFRVAACNNSGVWNEAGTFLDFSIAPAYYQTTWFRVSCVAVFLVLLWGIYRLRIQQLHHQFSIGLEARVNERTRIARELHDTLLQSFQGLMLRFQTVGEMLPARPLDARNALEGALDRADQAISEGRDAITDIRASSLASRDLETSITALMTNLSEELAAGSGRSVTFRVLIEGAPRTVRPTLQDEIYRIARESLRNAFRHAQAGHIETEITYGESLRLRFRDDGKGIDPSVVEHGGRSGHWGLPGIHERAKQIGAELTVWSELGAGTEVELSIPGLIAYEASSTRPRFRLFRKKTEQDHEHRS